MSDEQELEFSDEARKRFREIDPKDYDRTLRKLSWKASRLQLGYSFLFFLVSATLILAMTMAATASSGFTLIWVVVIAVSLFQAFKRMDSLTVVGEVRHLILRERLKKTPVSPSLGESLSQIRRNKERSKDADD